MSNVKSLEIMGPSSLLTCADFYCQYATKQRSQFSETHIGLWVRWQYTVSSLNTITLLFSGETIEVFYPKKKLARYLLSFSVMVMVGFNSLYINGMIQYIAKRAIHWFMPGIPLGVSIWRSVYDIFKRRFSARSPQISTDHRYHKGWLYGPLFWRRCHVWSGICTLVL